MPDPYATAYSDQALAPGDRAGRALGPVAPLLRRAAASAGARRTMLVLRAEPNLLESRAEGDGNGGYPCGEFLAWAFDYDFADEGGVLDLGYPW